MKNRLNCRIEPEICEDTRHLTAKMTTRDYCDRFFYPECSAAAQLDNLNELGYLTMTPVQAAALPAILEGAMFAYRQNRQGKRQLGLGLLQHIDATLFQTQSPRPANWLTGRG